MKLIMILKHEKMLIKMLKRLFKVSFNQIFRKDEVFNNA